MQTPNGYDRTGVVKEVCKEPQSYLVESEGKIFRRNCQHILRVPEPGPVQQNPDVTHDDEQELNRHDTLSHNTQETDTVRLQRNASLTVQPTNTAEELYQTRPGRVVKPNPKYRD